MVWGCASWSRAGAPSPGILIAREKSCKETTKSLLFWQKWTTSNFQTTLLYLFLRLHASTGRLISSTGYWIKLIQAEIRGNHNHVRPKILGLLVWKDRSHLSTEGTFITQNKLRSVVIFVGMYPHSNKKVKILQWCGYKSSYNFYFPGLSLERFWEMYPLEYKLRNKVSRFVQALCGYYWYNTEKETMFKSKSNIVVNQTGNKKSFLSSA